MGLLVGLPMKLLHMLLVVLRLAWPLLLVLLVWYLLRRRRRRGQTRWEQPPEPEFDGPVVEVDFEEVDGDQEGS